VAQDARRATSFNGLEFSPCLLLAEDFQSLAAGVGHCVDTDRDPVESLSDVRRADGRSAQICRRAGVHLAFQVSENNVEPVERSLSRNLLSTNDCRVTLLDKIEPDRPEVAFIGKTLTGSREAEGLTWAAPSPDGSVVGPSSQSKGVTPAANTGEEVTLGVGLEVIRRYILDRAFVNIAGRDVTFLDELA